MGGLAGGGCVEDYCASRLNIALAALFSNCKLVNTLKRHKKINTISQQVFVGPKKIF